MKKQTYLYNTIMLVAVLLAACSPRNAVVETAPSNAAVGTAAPSSEPLATPSAATTQVTASEPDNEAFVRIVDYIPDVIVDLKYASDNNFTEQTIYTFQDAYLRYGTVKKLSSGADELRGQGFRLLIWDAFRPTSAQWKLWKVCPDAAYVSDPNKGFSSHSRGNTVDATLALPDGTPADFDDFTARADRDYSDASAAAAQNATMLETVMKKNSFKPYSAEWWHFSDETAYAVEESFVPDK